MRIRICPGSRPRSTFRRLYSTCHGASPGAAAGDVPRLRKDARVLAGQSAQPAQETLRLRSAAEDAEVVAEHHDRVDDAQRLLDVGEVEQPCVAYAPPATDLDGAGRVVDRDDLVPALLKVQRDATCAGADVEHAASYKAHRLSVMCRPLSERSEVQLRPLDVCVDKPVLALDDLRHVRLALERGEHHRAVRVALGKDGHDPNNASTPGAFGSRAGRSSRHVQSFGSLSSRKRSSFVP